MTRIWENQKYGDKVYTRFPPEPNGYLHIGHAKAICINFGTAEKYGGMCNLRYDDTNPVKEDVEYVSAIEEDISWLGFKWDKPLWASNYFDKMYEAAVELIKKGKSLCLRAFCRGNQGISRNTDLCGQRKSVQKSDGRRKTCASLKK